MCNIAKKRGVKTYTGFFNYSNSKIIKKKFGKFDVLYAANVFNHVDNPDDFLKGCNNVLKKKSFIILEVPDLDSLINTCGFDTIYHEHRQYFSSDSIKCVLTRNGFNVIRIQKINYMSGSLRVFATKINKTNNKKIFFVKNKCKKNNLRKFLNFKKKIFIIKKEILKFIEKYKKKNQVIVGLAAATKGNTLLNFCNIDYHNIKCILENSPHKINKFTPGSAIPIINEKNFKKFDAAIIFPWNITNHLYKKFLFNKRIPYTSVSEIVKKIENKWSK